MSKSDFQSQCKEYSESFRVRISVLGYNILVLTFFDNFWLTWSDFLLGGSDAWPYIDINVDFYSSKKTLRSLVSKKVVFCYQVCCDLLWKKIVISVGEKFKKFQAESQPLENFLVTECFLTW